MRLSVIEKTCGCLAAEFSPATLKPGEITTLTLNVTVAPEQREQIQTVRFQATWTGPDGKEKFERARCGIRYAARVEYGVFPKQVIVAGVLGDEAWTHVRISSLSGTDEPPALSKLACTLPGWRVEPVDADLGTEATLYRVSGPVRALGMTDGEATWETPDPATPRIGVPIRVEGLTEYYSFPGGVWFTDGVPREPATRVVKLLSRRSTPTPPARIRLTPAAAQVEASLDGNALVVRWKGDARSIVGSTRAEVLSAGGEVLGRVPIVWYWTE